MNFPYFISQRIQNTKTTSFSGTVTRIGVGSIAIGLSVMIVAFAVLFGFKDAIHQKLFSLTPHIKVSKFSANESYEENPITQQSDLFRNHKSIKEIAHIQTAATKAGILKTRQDILGVVMKGINRDFDFKRFEPNIIKGQQIGFSKDEYSKDILISNIIANKLNLTVGNDVIIYFLNAPDRPRKLIVKGRCGKYSNWLVGDDCCFCSIIWF
eukprot:Opistho-2@25038